MGGKGPKAANFTKNEPLHRYFLKIVTKNFLTRKLKKKELHCCDFVIGKAKK